MNIWACLTVVKMKRLKARYEKWKDWKQYNYNSKFFQIMVFLGVIKSPTFKYWVYLTNWLMRQ